MKQSNQVRIYIYNTLECENKNEKQENEHFNAFCDCNNVIRSPRYGKSGTEYH